MSRFTRRLLIVVAIVVLAGCAAGYWLTTRGDGGGEGKLAATLYAVEPGQLTISVTESGSVKALNTVDIKSQVEGQTTVISLVDEGTEVTEEDVAAGKVLIELDSSNIKERLMSQEITFANAEASYTDAKEAYDIRLKQNESDINAARLKVRFALMDLQKYLGEDTAVLLVDSLDPNGTATIDISALAQDEELGGSGLQTRRDNKAKISLADEKLRRAESKLIWTRRLYEKEYTSLSDVEGDEFEVNRLTIELEQAQMALELFYRYEFPKEAERLLSDFQEAKLEMQRTEAKTRSQTAQAMAKLKSNEATYRLQKEKLEKLQEQLANCIIRATAPGMVVYFKGDNPWRQETVEEGMTVRERQGILQITNMDEMAVQLKVHEGAINKVKMDQRVRITLDAFVDMEFTGKVIKVAQMPEQQHWLLNQDTKVYATEATLDGAEGKLKPGLSAKVEIIIDELQEVLFVPVQAVVNRQGRKVCYVKQGGDLIETPVTTGQFNDSFIQITEGLNAGQQVSLTPPRLIASEEVSGPNGKKKPQKPAGGARGAGGGRPGGGRR